MTWREDRPHGDDPKFRHHWNPDGGLNLNLGSGKDWRDGFVNVDAYQPAQQLVDLDAYPWPWKDGAADNVAALNVLEHVARPDLFVDEVHRILKAGGRFYCQVPDVRDAEITWGPTTHRRGFHPTTFDYYDPSRDYGPESGTADNTRPARHFRVLYVQVSRRLRLGRLFDSYYHPRKYGFWFPNVGKPHQLRFVVEKI